MKKKNSRVPAEVALGRRRPDKRRRRAAEAVSLWAVPER